MIIEYENKQYEIIFGSDIRRDGMFVELTPLAIRDKHANLGLEAFRSDRDGSFTFSAQCQDIPVAVVEMFLHEAKAYLFPANQPETEA